MEYDLLIPVAKKDIPALPYCLESIPNLFPQPSDVYFVTPCTNDVKSMVDSSHHVVHDLEVFDFCGNGAKPSWFQQMLKMYQRVTRDTYLVLDSDVMITKNFPLFSQSGKPFLDYFPYSRPWEGHRQWIKEAFGVVTPYKQCFICHHMMFMRDVWLQMLQRFLEIHPNETGRSAISWFYDWHMSLGSEYDLRITEFEAYASYVLSTSVCEQYEVRSVRAADTESVADLREPEVHEKLWKNASEWGAMVSFHQRGKFSGEWDEN